MAMPLGCARAVRPLLCGASASLLVAMTHKNDVAADATPRANLAANATTPITPFPMLNAAGPPRPPQLAGPGAAKEWGLPHVDDVAITAYAANAPIEDRFALLPLPVGEEGATLLCVFDGHGGWQTAEFAAKVLPRALRDAAKKRLQGDDGKGEGKDGVPVPPTPQQVMEELRRAYVDVDRALYRTLLPAFKAGFGELNHVGSCALSVVITPTHTITANAGDCRAVLARRPKRTGAAFEALTLTRDNNAKHDYERAALAEAHPDESPDQLVRCKPNNPDACYVKGRLQPTRALGDFYLKSAAFNGPVKGERWRGRHIPEPYHPPYITATPETKAVPRDSRDAFIVLACDGVWDAMTSEEVVSFIGGDKGDRVGVASRLADEVLRREAEACGMSKRELMSLPPGRARRSRHDDITIIVAYYDDKVVSRASSSGGGWFAGLFGGKSPK